MEEEAALPGPGERRVTCTWATPDTCGAMVPEYRKALRRPGANVVVKGIVSGHGGDYLWCCHEDNTVAPYATYELRLPDQLGDDYLI